MSSVVGLVSCADRWRGAACLVGAADELRVGSPKAVRWYSQSR